MKDYDADRVRKEKLKEQFATADDKDVDNMIGVMLERPEGRKFLWWLLEQCQEGRNPATGNALTTHFNCGELNVGLKLKDRIIRVNPIGYSLMVQEKADEQGRRNDILAGRDNDDAGGGDDDSD